MDSSVLLEQNMLMQNLNQSPQPHINHCAPIEETKCKYSKSESEIAVTWLLDSFYSLQNQRPEWGTKQ